MKLKKFLLILLSAVSCICLGFAFGCKEENEDDKKGSGNGTDTAVLYEVNFALSEHVNYVIDGKEVEESKQKVEKQTTLKFSVVVEEGFLSDTVVIKANGETLAQSDGVYSLYVTEDTTVTATVSEDLLEYDETDKVYLISSLKDLRFVADMVNSGYPNYVTGSYRLLNDIDCGGAQLDVIGHFENQFAFFAGIFDGQNHTISNYTISTVGKTYVGLFGCVQLSTSSSSAIIQNLNLKGFTVNATAADDGSVCVGGIAAFTAGANVVACSAEGNVNVYGSGYFSYAGGAVGIQQSLTITGADNLLYHYHSTTEYVHTKVVLAADLGYISAAGGVVGYAISSHERAPSMIMNSYAEGSVFGAMSSGGVVGKLDDYSSVANCYATGFVNATVTFEGIGEVEDREYFAYAGGIAGYVGVETTISDSFTTCTLNAHANNVGMAMGDIYAYASPATEFVNAVTVFNSYATCKPMLIGGVINSFATPGGANPTDESFIKETLKWNDADWIIKDGDYPATNFAQGEIDFEITLKYLGNNKVENSNESTVPVNIKDQSYFPFSSHLGDTIKEYIVADAAGHTSYGFYFDEDCTKKVHYSFIPTRDVTLYVGFADYSEVAGTYEFVQETGRTVKLILNTDATYSYVDVMSFGGTYAYDGNTVKFSEALFARLSGNTVIGENNTPQPWLNFEPYKFIGFKDVFDGKLYVYDGTFFTNDNKGLLVFNLAGEQSQANNFIGTWEVSATINEKYTFNSDLTWTYSWKGNTKSGKYSVDNGVATLTNTAGDTVIATASIDNSGLLLINEAGGNEKYFCLENSFYGNWYSIEDGAYLVLGGCGNGLEGSAAAIIDGTVYDNLAYVKDGFFDAWTPGNPYNYTIISGYSLFGYFTYDVDSRTITAYLYAGNYDWLEFDFILYDYYLGEWIGEDEVDGDKPFTVMDFNGLGLYKAEGNAKLGYIVINGTKVPYDCSVENGLDGKFTYNGTDYVLTTNGDGTVTIKFGTNDENSANFYRKDEMASTPLVDEDDNVYEFNGGGHLSKGGILTKTSKKGVKLAEYVYTIESGSIDDLDIVINLYSGSVSGNKVGSITIRSTKFVLKLDGQDEVSLDLYFAFAGRYWSISGLMNSFYIGKFDLTYRAIGTYNRNNNVPFDYYPEYNYIRIFYGNQFDGYVLNYLLLLDDGNIIVSSYPYFVSSDEWHYASPSDEFVGKWNNTETGTVLEFDGLADSKYTVGEARESNGLTYLYTRRFGTLYMWLYDDESVAYTVEISDDDELTGANVYSKQGSKYDRVVLTEADVLNEPIMTATDGDGTEYEFNFDGTVKVGDKSGTYLINSVAGNKTTVEIRLDGEVITVEVNHNGTATVID